MSDPVNDETVRVTSPILPRGMSPVEWFWWGVLIVSVSVGLGMTWFGPN